MASAQAGANQPGGGAAASAYQQTSSLYRKYRPNSFAADELVGQNHIVRTLQNAVRLNRVAHAYLFSGPRGTGKTTTARLLAKAVNCLAEDPGDRPCNACANCLAINSGSSPDIIEIDAASNRGIDDIRDLREKVRYAPSQLPSKVYIIDEAHQITGAAANAFLKTLEEPPAHSRFILATTDPEELLATIVSRCQRFEFRRHSADDMARRMRTVATAEGIDVADDALLLIGRHATGSLRDALGLLELLAMQAGGAATITAGDVRAALGLSRNERIEELAAALAARDAATGLALVQAAVDEGEDPRQLNRQLTSYLRTLMLAKAAGDSDDARAGELARLFSLPDLAAHAQQFAEIDFTIKHSPFPQLPLEIAIVAATAGREESQGAAPAASREPSSSQVEHMAYNDAPPASPRLTSLRDRVRGPGVRDASAGVPGREPAAPMPAREPQAPASMPQRDPAPAAPPAPMPAARAEPAPITPIRAAASPASASASDAAYNVADVVEMWPRIRSDVKAINRRIEALLSEVDPVAVSATQVRLAVPYPFHRDKLNSDDVRDAVSSVLSRNLGRPVTIACVLRGEFVPQSAPVAITADRPPVATTQAPTAAPERVPAAPATPPDPEDDADEARVLAAMNLLDAEPLDDEEVERLFGDASRH